MWRVLINSRWRKARRYDYDRVIALCNNTTYLIDSKLVKYIER